MINAAKKLTPLPATGKNVLTAVGITAPTATRVAAAAVPVKSVTNM